MVSEDSTLRVMVLPVRVLLVRVLMKICIPPRRRRLLLDVVVAQDSAISAINLHQLLYSES